MLRAKRSGVAATFSWLTIVMHGVLAALMVFVLEILKKFISLMGSVVSPEQQEEAMRAMALQVVSFGAPQVKFFQTITIGLLIILALINAFAIVASEGSHILKMSFYLSIMLFLSGASLLVVPMLANLVM